MKTPRSTLLALALSLAALPLLASPSVDGILAPGEYANNIQVGRGQFLVSWTIEGESITMAVQARTTGWVAIGFGVVGRAMNQADMVFGSASPGKPGKALDCFSTGPTGPHPVDTKLGGADSLAASTVVEKDGVTTMEFRRPLAATDRFDKPIAPGAPFIWAFGGSDAFESMHRAAGQGQLSGS